MWTHASGILLVAEDAIHETEMPKFRFLGA